MKQPFAAKLSLTPNEIRAKHCAKLNLLRFGLILLKTNACVPVLTHRHVLHWSIPEQKLDNVA